MNEPLFRRLLDSHEGTALDFKTEAYPFEKSDRLTKSKLLRDVLAFANADRIETAHILLGVREENGNIVDTPGIPPTSHPDDAKLQQFVNEKLNRPIAFSYRPYKCDGKEFGVIAIPCQDRPFFAQKTYGDVKENTIYYRSGSSTSIADLRKVYEMGRADTSHVQKFFRQEVDRLRQVFDLEGEGVPVGDVLRGLCALDLDLRATASYYVYTNRVEEAVPLLLSNLDANHDDLTLMTTQAIGRLRVTAAADKLIGLVEEGKPRIAGTAMAALRNMGTEAVTQENLAAWISWLLSDDEFYWEGALSVLRASVREQRLDVASLKPCLVPLTTSGPHGRREGALELLFQVEGISKEVDLGSIIEDPATSEAERWWCYCIASADGDPSFLAQLLGDRLAQNPSDDDYFDLRKLAVLLRDVDEPSAQEAFSAFLRWSAAGDIGESEETLAYFQGPARMPSAPGALAMGKITRELVGLHGDAEFSAFMMKALSLSPVIPGRRALPLIRVSSESPYTTAGVLRFLKEDHGFHVLDYRGADSAFIKRSANDLRRHGRVVMVFPSVLPLELCHFCAHLYDSGTVNLTAVSPTESEFELPPNSVILGLITDKDYRGLELRAGWPRHKFDRIISLIHDL